MSVVILVLTLCVQAILPNVAYAAGGFVHGDGSAGAPYRIANCEQLQQIDEDLVAHYKLVSDIDCTGVDFGHLAAGSAFGGTLSGNNHTIKNLSLDDAGLFETIDGGGEVKDLFLEGGSVSSASDAVGSIAGRMNVGTITNVHSSMSVTSSDINAGGLVGLMGQSGIVSQSSYTGTVTGYRNVGGIVGQMAGSAYIFDNYTRATINSTDTEDARYFGGIIGRVQVPPAYVFISRVYSNSTINVLPDAQGVGGLIGYTEGASIGVSFSATTINGGGTNIGEVYGVFSDGSSSDIVAYEELNSLPCAGIGNPGGTPAHCDSVLVDLNPNALKGNSSNMPFNFDNNQYWDFTTNWTTVEDDYPELRAAAPRLKQNANIADANGDTYDDRFQSNVLPIMVQGEYFNTVELDPNSPCAIDDNDSNTGWLDPEYVTDDAAHDYPAEMVQFQVLCPDGTDSVRVTVVLDQLLEGDLVLRYFNPDTQTYSTIEGAVFGTREVNGNQVTTATYALVNDGPNDLDTTNPGVIFDPVGIGVTAQASSSNDGNSSAPNSDQTLANSGTNLIAAYVLVAALSLTTLGLHWTRRARRYDVTG